jgi:hypothetical protein
VFLGVTAAAVWVAYLRKSRSPQGPRDPVNRRSVPLAELLSALVAAGAWGLAMPGSAFNIQIGGTTRVLATASIVIGAAALLTLLRATAQVGNQDTRRVISAVHRPTCAPTAGRVRWRGG